MRAAGAAMGLVFAAAGIAAKAETVQPVRVELNKLEPVENGCRVWLLVENGAAALERLTLDLVSFNPEGVIASRLAVELGPLRADKTAVKAFPLRGADCAQVGRLLLNDVTACDGAGENADCMALVAPAARGKVEFVK